ncbi:TerB N-terminal domain-containing protein [Methylorubrum extorquens]|uniref:TerB N-terminal domain-containing protein n=2 Tax=Methylorubrum extorquens TaxID=408 RepID=UPI0028166E9A|nr:TerB N-terminal domain-containing protein [Methylorubrum extorquens]
MRTAPRWLLLCGMTALAGSGSIPSPASAQQSGPVAPARAVQADLRALGFEPGVIDGRWGRQSLQALLRFQRKESLPPTGRADPVTVARLRERRQAVVAPPGGIETATPSVSAPTWPTSSAPPPPALPATLAATADGTAQGGIESLTTPGGGAAISDSAPQAPPVTDPPTAPAANAAPDLTRAFTDASETEGEALARSGPGRSDAMPRWALGLLAGGLLAFWGMRRRSRAASGGARASGNDPDKTSERLGDAQGGPAPPPATVPRDPDSTVHQPPVGAPLVPAAQPVSPYPVVPPVGLVQADGASPATPPSTPTEPRATFGTRGLPPQLSASAEAPPPRPAGCPDREAATPKPPAKPSPSPHRTAGDKAWIPAGARTTVAGFAIPGLVYVGRILAPAEGYGRNDNCLVDPGLTVSKSNADAVGQNMDYWPAYESMRPSSRRAFLEWLSGDRAGPDTYIGYVFVYLYGLERRAVLERSVEDRPAIRAEVERLLAVYGHHGSFRRYAGDLLAVLDILDLAPGQDPAPVFFPSGGDLPLEIRIGVGARIRDGRPVDADWLLAWTMSHPETRVRTPARRAFEHLRPEFATEFGRRNPSGGLPLKVRKGGTSPILYRAASGTFSADLGPTGAEGLPDLARYPEALATGRELLELCTERFDAYSRYLGRGGASAGETLQALALLPPGRRRSVSREAAGDGLAWLAARAAAGAPVPFQDVCARVGGQPQEKATPARLRDLADTLCRFGLGLIPDPRFPLRAPSSSAVLLFPLDAPSESVGPPSDIYKAAFLTLSVGMLVAKADGEVTDDERSTLNELVATTPGLAPDERRRLAADACWLEAHPAELPSLRSRLSELDTGQRQSIGDALVRVASSDGSHHRAEIALLEKAFRQMGLDQDRLYAALHRAGPGPDAARAAEAPDDLVRVALGTGSERTYAIPGAPAPIAAPRPSAAARQVAVTDTSSVQGGRTVAAEAADQVDAERLMAIRAETFAISAVLAGVFDTEPEAANAGSTGAARAEEDAAEAGGAFAGLDPRHARLLRELIARPAWPRAEFDRLAREFGLMPGAAMEDLNAWAYDCFDDVLVEEGDPVHVNLHLLPETLSEAA